MRVVAIEPGPVRCEDGDEERVLAADLVALAIGGRPTNGALPPGVEVRVLGDGAAPPASSPRSTPGRTPA